MDQLIIKALTHLDENGRHLRMVARELKAICEAEDPVTTIEQAEMMLFGVLSQLSKVIADNVAIVGTACTINTMSTHTVDDLIEGRFWGDYIDVPPKLMDDSLTTVLDHAASGQPSEGGATPGPTVHDLWMDAAGYQPTIDESENQKL